MTPQNDMPRISPILAHIVYNDDPEKFEETVKKIRYDGHYENDDAHIHLVKDTNNTVYARSYGEHRFASGYVYICPLEIQDKLAEILIGKPLSFLIDVPYAKNCTITRINNNNVFFENADSDYNWDDSPINNKLSYKWMKYSKQLIELKNIKFSQIAANVIRRAHSVMGAKKMIRRYIEKSYFTSEMIQDNLIKDVIIPNNGEANLYFNNDISITNGVFNTKELLPETIVLGLSGQPAKVLIDHWSLEDVKIKKATKLKTKVKVVFDNQPVASFDEMFPGMIDEEYEHAIKNYEKKASPSHLRYRDLVAKGLR